MIPIQVIGVGLDGAAGLSPSALQLIEQATILAGSDRHLSYFPDHPAQRWSLAGLVEQLRDHLNQSMPGLVVILTSGDPLFFGLGRQLLQALPAEVITFHPHVSSIQLAFSRVKLPWQEATLISAHGRSLDRLEAVLKKGHTPIAVLTDPNHSPGAIARLIETLALPFVYKIWICENLGGPDEQVRGLSLTATQQVSVSPLNVVILQRLEPTFEPTDVPILGISDQAFLSFADRPGLMTKREVRVQILAELGLQPHQIIWDIGAGTGSVSIEIARLVPTAQIWAVEKTTAGCALIRQNCQRFEIENITVRQSEAPTGLASLPDPHRIFVGGSGGHLKAVLTACSERLQARGKMVVALATLENLADVTHWLQHHPRWQGHYLQVALSRSVAIGSLNRWAPLNPVTLVSLSPQTSPQGTENAPNQGSSGNH